MTLKADISRQTVENYLEKKEGLSHIQVRARGDVLTLESIDERGNRYPHARFKKRTIHIWSLQMPARRGWESTPIEGTLNELVDVLVENFPWTLTPL